MTYEAVLSWWSFIFLGAVVYWLGQQAKKLAPRLPWQWMRTAYDRTVVAHAPIAAALIAVVPAFPMPDDIPGTWLSRTIFGVVAGVFAAWSYKLISRVLGKDTKSKTARDSQPPEEAS